MLSPSTRLVLCVLCSGACAPESQPTGVGFRVVQAADSTRRYLSPAGEVPRPVQLMVWYPGSGGRPLTYADYVRAPTDSSRLGPAAAAVLLRGIFETSFDTTLSPARFEAAVAAPVPATDGARPEGHARPLVILTPGLRAPAFGHSELAERLAAAGHVAVAWPSFGTAHDSALGFDPAGIRVLLDDLRQVIRVARGLPSVDPTRVLLVAWSVTGVPAVQLAIEDSTVRGLISLDAATEYAYGDALLDSLGVDAARLTVPSLHLVAGSNRFNVPRSDRTWRSRPPSLATRLVIPDLAHGEFLAVYGVRNPVSDDSTRVRVRSASDQVWRMVERFVAEAAPAAPHRAP